MLQCAFPCLLVVVVSPVFGTLFCVVHKPKLAVGRCCYLVFVRGPDQAWYRKQLALVEQVSMANAPAAKANAAFVDEDYDLALALYKQARLLC